LKSVRYIPFLRTHPQLKSEMLTVFEQFYDDKAYILGPGLKKFEKAYAAFNGVKYGIGVGNGHDALLIILKCLGIGTGDEVILPAHTFIATALSVINSGARPVFADVDPHTFNIDPLQAEQKITTKTKAIVPVHLYGNPADVKTLLAISRKHEIHLIEDNAQAQGAGVGGRKTGSFGVMNFTSFYPTKNIGAFGDGGMITTNSDELAEKARILLNYGKNSHGDYSEVGINSRLDELQARLLSVKLKYLEKWNQERIKIAKWYESELKNISEIKLQQDYDNSINVRHIFPLLTAQRNDLKEYLNSKSIETLVHYPYPIHLQPAFSFLNHKPGDFPLAEKVCKQELSLPIYPGLRKVK
jgi:dTDP-4-amino-4,6-dideoxygalactose transaminase